MFLLMTTKVTGTIKKSIIAIAFTVILTFIIYFSRYDV